LPKIVWPEIERIRQLFFGAAGIDGSGRRYAAQASTARQGRGHRRTSGKEYQTAHIPQALSIPLQELCERLAELPRNN
jgi:hypothetical protein